MANKSVRAPKRSIEIIEPGFTYKDKEYVHHGTLGFKDLAFKQLIPKQYAILTGIGIVLLIALLLDWHGTLLTIIAVLSVYYIVQILFDLLVAYRSLSGEREVHISSQEIAAYTESWPSYTILCPLYKEEAVLPQFINAMKQLDYPQDKLQILLLLEEDDNVTRKALKKLKVSSIFETVIVPDSQPKTKPKALNYGLKKAKGEYVAIYDAEDIPDAKQLKRAVLAFGKAEANVACIQCKLDYYNPRQNVLTRVFTAEYALWFDLVLPGLQSLGAPIPLGGTSNHFQTELLRELGGWDAFNVTEDADLGIRLAKQGFKTQVINSITFEEASSRPRIWFSQRRRWIKGYIQTYFVHTRRFRDFKTSPNNLGGVMFQLVVGGKVALMFINPIMLLLTIIYYVFRSSIGASIDGFFPAAVLTLAVISFIFGNFAYMYYYMLGSAKREHYQLIKFVFLVPLYWLAMSAAAYAALFEMIFHPHYWHKTTHGHHLVDDTIFHSSLESVKE